MSTEPVLDHPRYTQIQVLGRGAFGSVLLAKDTQTGRPVAVKLIYRGPQVTQYVEREAFTHRLLCHPHIIKFREVFLTPQFLGIVLEYANLGDLYTYVISRTRLTEDQARWFFQQLMIAVDYLHKLGIAHRDIKLENILLAGTPAQPIVKLCDFGYAKNVNCHSIPNSTVGTPTYMAPEVLTQREYNGQVADIWSCGVVLFVMLVGQYPFEHKGDKDLALVKRQQLLLQRLLSENPCLPDDVKLTDECCDLLQRMLWRDPSTRVTVAHVLAHPWFQKNLPRGVLEMNHKCYIPAVPQNPEHIRKILMDAREVYITTHSTPPLADVT